MNKTAMLVDRKVHALAEYMADDAEPRTAAERESYVKRLAEALQIAFENELDDIRTEREAAK